MISSVIIIERDFDGPTACELKYAFLVNELEPELTYRSIASRILSFISSNASVTDVNEYPPDLLAASEKVLPILLDIPENFCDAFVILSEAPDIEV
ncbi:MAG: hypothetical protein A4E23_00093 [Methanomethylovorans sp. PtaU1.Bin073]|nr:MAG: hypothetical protein A4E23_00093 [Methanomethylovorans sp. PtaU1.Bin073]